MPPHTIIITLVIVLPLRHVGFTLLLRYYCSLLLSPYYAITFSLLPLPPWCHATPPLSPLLATPFRHYNILLLHIITLRHIRAPPLRHYFATPLPPLFSLFFSYVYAFVFFIITPLLSMSIHAIIIVIQTILRIHGYAVHNHPLSTYPTVHYAIHIFVELLSAILTLSIHYYFPYYAAIFCRCLLLRDATFAAVIIAYACLRHATLLCRLLIFHITSYYMFVTAAAYAHHTPYYCLCHILRVDMPRLMLRRWLRYIRLMVIAAIITLLYHTPDAAGSCRATIIYAMLPFHYYRRSPCHVMMPYDISFSPLFAETLFRHIHCLCLRHSHHTYATNISLTIAYCQPLFTARYRYHWFTPPLLRSLSPYHANATITPRERYIFIIAITPLFSSSYATPYAMPSTIPSLHAYAILLRYYVTWYYYSLLPYFAIIVCYYRLLHIGCHWSKPYYFHIIGCFTCLIAIVIAIMPLLPLLSAIPHINYASICHYWSGFCHAPLTCHYYPLIRPFRHCIPLLSLLPFAQYATLCCHCHAAIISFMPLVRSLFSLLFIVHATLAYATTLRYYYHAIFIRH